MDESLSDSALDLKQYVYTRDCMSMIRSYPKSANLEPWYHWWLQM